MTSNDAAELDDDAIIHISNREGERGERCADCGESLDGRGVWDANGIDMCLGCFWSRQPLPGQLALMDERESRRAATGEGEG